MPDYPLHWPGTAPLTEEPPIPRPWPVIWRW